MNGKQALQKLIERNSRFAALLLLLIL